MTGLVNEETPAKAWRWPIIDCNSAELVLALVFPMAVLLMLWITHA